MADPQQVAGYRQSYSKKTRGELIEIMHEFVAYSEMHIAARQLLEEMDRRDIDDRYRSIENHIIGLQKPHWTVLPNFWLTAVSAIAAVLAGYFAWLSLRPEEKPLPSATESRPSTPSPTPPKAPEPPQPTKE